MSEDIETFKKNVQISFKKAKEDIDRLHSKLDNLRELLDALIAQNSSFKEEEPEKPPEIPEIPINSPPLEEKKVSKGNEGVYSFIHSFNSHSTVIHSDTKLFLSKLTKQEILTFLTLFQLEEEQPTVTYTDLARKLNLSEGCIRTYISALIKKGAPVLKQHYNNKLVILLIPKEFRELRPKQLIIDYYYRNDPAQKKLFEDSFKP